MQETFKNRSQLKGQKGIALIEALIAILIFSIGVMGIVGLQGYAVKQTASAKYRSDASLLANQIIGQMWAGDRTPATLQANFQSPSGPAYLRWAWQGSSATATGNTNISAGTATTPAAGTVLATLPGSDTSPPSIVVTTDISGSVPTNMVTVTVFWQEPGDNTTHSYVSVAQIGG